MRSPPWRLRNRCGAPASRPVCLPTPLVGSPWNVSAAARLDRMGVRGWQGLRRRVCRGCYIGRDLTGLRSCAPRAHNDAYWFRWAKLSPHVNRVASQINRNVLMGHRDPVFGRCGGPTEGARRFGSRVRASRSRFASALPRGGPAGRSDHRLSAARRTVCISSVARLWPGQRFLPPPQGIHRLGCGGESRNRSGRKQSGIV